MSIVHVQSKREISLLLALLFMIMSLFGRGDVSVRLYSAGTAPPALRDRPWSLAETLPYLSKIILVGITL